MRSRPTTLRQAGNVILRDGAEILREIFDQLGLHGGLIATMPGVTAGQLASRSTPLGMRIATR